MVCSAHGVEACIVCMTDEMQNCTAACCRRTSPPVPRNLRKPTSGRVLHYWNDFVEVWRGIGVFYWHESALLEEMELR